MFISAPAGKFTGYESGKAVRFLGIPYAKADRFMRPVPVTFEDGYDCKEYGAKSIQNTKGMMGPVPGPFAEDCLYLNIVIPKENPTGAPLPVVLDIHGGAFQTGSGNDCGQFTLVEEEGAPLIAVSFNYRLGALGYLYLKDMLPETEADGNLGMYDQLAAIKWVHENIAAFGGDPERVTLHGISAGGKSVGAMMLTPEAKPLFNQAILSSGGIMAVRTPETAQVITGKYLEILGLEKIEEILTVSADKILEAQLEFAKSAGSTCLFGPVSDDILIPTNWKEDIRSESGWMGNTLVGNNLHELCFYAMNPNILEAAPAIAAELFGDRDAYANKAFAELSEGKTEEEKKQIWVDIFSDFMYRTHGDKLSQIMAARGGKTWTYSFDYPPAHHSQDAVTLKMGGKAGGPMKDTNPDGPAIKDRLMKEMRASFIAFITGGDPNNDLVPAWPAVEPGMYTRIHWGEETVVIAHDTPQSITDFPDDVSHMEQ